MKKKLLSYVKASALIIALLSGKAFAQTATATWVLSAGPSGVTSGSDASSIIVADQTITGLELKNYAAIATPTTGYNTGLSVTAQRILPTVASGWPGGEAAEVTGRYSEYKVSPIAGKSLTVTSVSIDFGDSGSTSTMKANIYYSTDDFATRSILQSAFVLPKFSAAETWTQYSNTGLSISVPDSKSLKIRVYPWYSSGTSTSKYLVQSNIKITSTISDAVLPLTFTAISGKADGLGKTVDLNWSTTNEVNTKSFEVQRKTAGSDFASIGSLASKNTAGVHHYSFTDQNAKNGTAYYRILQSDHDGASKLSNVIAVNNKAVSALSVYPNPAEQTLNVNHASAAAGANLKVLSLDGKTIFQKAVTTNSTSSNLDVSKLVTGTYLLILDNNSEKSSMKFIKK
jgi:hypothetical protein